MLLGRMRPSDGIPMEFDRCLLAKHVPSNLGDKSSICCHNTTRWATGTFPEVCRSRVLAGLPGRASQKPDHGVVRRGRVVGGVRGLRLPSPRDLLGIYRVAAGGGGVVLGPRMEPALFCPWRIL